MKNNFIFWLVISMLIMLILPWFAISFVNSDAGMAVCLILFFVINPIYSVIMGAFAGKNIKTLWAMPLVSSVLFLIGAWIFFGMGEKTFIMYAGIYLIIGTVVMMISKARN